MRVLVTGAAGFVGSNIVDQLLTDGFSVRGIDDFNEYYDPKIKWRNLTDAQLSPKFELVNGDLNSISDLRSLIEDVDYIFHQAGQPGVRSSWGTEFGNYLQDNVLGTQRLLEACKSVNSIQKIIYASSSSVYGSAESSLTSENQIPKPLSPYGITKLAAEHLCSAYASQFGLPIVSLRYFTVYGPRQRPDMAIHRLLTCAREGTEFTLWGDGSFERDFTFIGDVVNANILAAKGVTKPGEVFNVGGGNPIRMKNLIELIQEISGSVLNIKFSDNQPGDPASTSADSSRIHKVLGWQKTTMLDEGLRAQFAAMNIIG